MNIHFNGAYFSNTSIAKQAYKHASDLKLMNNDGYMM